MKEYLEKIYVYIVLGFLNIIPGRGRYRLARMLYPYNSTLFSGIELIIKYLNDRYGLLIRLNSRDLIDHKILFTGSYEEESNSLLEEYVQNGDNVIEAGANSGTETLLISRLAGEKGKVFAFEPVPHIMRKLKENVDLNNIRNVDFFNMALGNEDGEITFNINSKEHPNQGMGTVLKIDFEEGEKIIVPIHKLDTVWESRMKNKRISFLKMDVQGSEYDLLKGAGNLIRANKPKIFLEANSHWSNLNDLYTLLRDMGYSVFPAGSGKRLTTKIHYDHLPDGNWIAIPDKIDP